MTTSIDINNEGVSVQFSGDTPTTHELIALLQVARLIPDAWKSKESINKTSQAQVSRLYKHVPKSDEVEQSNKPLPTDAIANAFAETYANNPDPACKPQSVKVESPTSNRPYYGQYVQTDLACDQCGFTSKTLAKYGWRFMACPKCHNKLRLSAAGDGFGEKDANGNYYLANRHYDDDSDREFNDMWAKREAEESETKA